MAFCKDCGHSIVETDKFCENCGSKTRRAENCYNEVDNNTVDQSHVEKDSREVINYYLDKVSQPQNKDKGKLFFESILFRKLFAGCFIAIIMILMFGFLPFHKTGGLVAMIWGGAFFFFAGLIWKNFSKPPKEKITTDNISKNIFTTVYEGDINEVRRLIEVLHTDVCSIDEDGNTALHWVTEQTNIDIAQYLILKGANVNAKSNEGETPLHYAASEGCLEMVKFLISQGTDINLKTKSGQTALYLAQQSGYDDVANYLSKL